MSPSTRPPVVLALDVLHQRRWGNYPHARATPIDLGPRAGLWFSICPCCGDCLHAGERNGAEVLLCRADCKPAAIRARMVAELTRGVKA